MNDCPALNKAGPRSKMASSRHKVRIGSNCVIGQEARVRCPQDVLGSCNLIGGSMGHHEELVSFESAFLLHDAVFGDSYAVESSSNRT